MIAFDQGADACGVGFRGDVAGDSLGEFGCDGGQGGSVQHGGGCPFGAEGQTAVWLGGQSREFVQFHQHVFSGDDGEHEQAGAAR